MLPYESDKWLLWRAVASVALLSFAFAQGAADWLLFGWGIGFAVADIVVVVALSCQRRWALTTGLLAQTLLLVILFCFLIGAWPIESDAALWQGLNWFVVAVSVATALAFAVLLRDWSHERDVRRLI